MPADKQDSNLVGFYKIREAAYGVVPATGFWRTLEPNSFDDFGADYSKTPRKPFTPSRQRQKGQTTDLDADGGFNQDLTQNNMKADLEEFFFAALRKTPEQVVGGDGFSRTFTVNTSTDVVTTAAHGLVTGDGPFFVSSSTTLPAGLTAATPYWVSVIDATTFELCSSRANAVAGTQVDITSTGTGTHTMTRAAVVASADNSYTVNNVPSGCIANSILFASGFSNAANNGLKTVTSVTASKIIASAGGLVNETAPPYEAKVKVVGHTFASADVALALITGGFTLTTTAGDFRIWNLVPGSWLFIGSDAADTGFTPGGMYARIAPNGISANGKVLTFDKSTVTPVADAGTGKTIVIYFSDVVKNESDPSLIVRYSSVIERTLGRDDNGVQSEYLTGAVANEITITSPLAALVNADLNYIAQGATQRTGTQGPMSARAGNTRLGAPGEDAFNTSSNLFRLRMALVDPVTLNPTPYFARVTEWKGMFKNNVTSAKAQGVLGGFDTVTGNFDVDIEVTAYFSTVDAINAVKANSNVTFDALYAKSNAGLYFDIPQVNLGGGKLTVEQDAAILLPLQSAASQSPFGHTALVGWFDYLPNIAMAQ